MNRWKGSIAAKIMAWVGITVSAVVFVGSVLGAWLIWDLDIYDDTEEEMREQAVSWACDQYAVRALYCLQNPQDEGESELIDSYFRYGIIKADNIDGLDLNKDSTYVRRNFTEEVVRDDLYLVSYEMGENTGFYYSDTIFGSCGIYEQANSYTTSTQMYQVCYDSESGVFYYETPGALFPVQTVECIIEGIWCSFEYDFGVKKYRNYQADWEKTTTGEWEEPTTEIVNESDEQKLNETLSQNYITFQMLDNTSGSYFDIKDSLVLDGAADADIVYATDDYLAGKEITDETDYYLDGNDIIRINHVDQANTDNYWVVCVLPKSRTFGWSEDLFVQADTVATLAWNLRYGIYGIMVAALAVGIFCFVFLIAAAGHRKGTAEIKETAIDLVPFDIYLVVAFVMELVFFCLADELSYHLPSFPAGALFGVMLLCMGWVALLTLLTLAVRIKTKRWWKNTMVYRIFAWMRQLFDRLMESLPLLWKSALILLGIFVADFIITLIALDGRGVFVLLWLIEKLLIAALVFGAVLQMKKLKEGGEKMAEGDLTHQIDTNQMYWEFKEHGENLNRIGEGMSHAVDERMKSERFKTELITNVSHDIKTPLTSIINYVDLLEKEELNNETAEEYLDVLDRQSGRLKKLIEDLIEASKASSGRLPVHLEKLEAGIFMVQTVGEFEEKTKANDLELLIKKPEEPVYIMADRRHFWRVIDNLMNNICKYAQPSTRVYINMEVKEEKVILIFRNTSKYPLNISNEELMERFVRGDESRNTEGSGLGLSIANSLMELMGGTFTLYVDGDLFKVELQFVREK